MDTVLLTRHNIEYVPHGKKAKVYKDLLKGHPYTPPPTNADRAMELDVEIAQRRNQSRAGCERDSDSDDAEGGAGSTTHEDADVLASLEEALDDLMEEAVEAPILAVEGGAAPPAAGEHVSQGDQDAPAQRIYHGGSWGPFHIVQKLTFGRIGYEATCPYHRGTDTAKKCKHFIGVADVQEMTECEAKIKAWCIASQQYDRKRTHLRHRPALGDLNLAELERNS